MQREKRDSSLGFCVAYKKIKPRTFKATRENIFGGICRTMPTDRNEKLPGQRMSSMAFVLAGIPERIHQMWACGRPFRKGSI
jgi:hypothetical protein